MRFNVLRPESVSNISIAFRWSFSFIRTKETARLEAVAKRSLSVTNVWTSGVLSAPCVFNFSAAASQASAASWKSSTSTFKTWLTTIFVHGTVSSLNDFNSRPLSLMPKTVGMVAMTNSVVSLFRNKSFTSCKRFFKFSNFSTATSWFSFS